MKKNIIKAVLCFTGCIAIGGSLENGEVTFAKENVYLQKEDNSASKTELHLLYQKEMGNGLIGQVYAKEENRSGTQSVKVTLQYFIKISHTNQIVVQNTMITDWSYDGAVQDYPYLWTYENKPACGLATSIAYVGSSTGTKKSNGLYIKTYTADFTYVYQGVKKNWLCSMEFRSDGTYDMTSNGDMFI